MDPWALRRDAGTGGRSLAGSRRRVPVVGKGGQGGVLVGSVVVWCRCLGVSGG